MRPFARTPGRLLPAPAVLALLAGGAFARADARGVEPAPGEPVDLAPFGVASASGGSLMVEWTDPREVREVRALYPEGSAPPAASLRLEWWGSVWPENGSGGWMRLDDPWNGRWVAVPVDPVPAGPGVLSFTLPRLTAAEWKGARAPGPDWRRTLQVRVTAAAGPPPRALVVLGRSLWRRASFDIELGSAAGGERAGRVEAANGLLLSLESLPPPRAVEVRGGAWRGASPPGGSLGIRAAVLYAENADRASNDHTRVTVRLGADPEATGFSFVPEDVLAEGSIHVRDLDALVSESGRGITLGRAAGAPRGLPVRLRVAERPEMTRAAALAGIPRLPPRPVPLGVPCARQEVVVTPRGDWTFSADSLHTRARDSERIRWGKSLSALLDTRDAPSFDGGDREGLAWSLEEGHLPVIHVTWRTGRIAFRHSLCASTLAGRYGDDEGRRGDEPVVLLARLEIENLDEAPRPARVSLRWSSPAPVELQGDGTLALASAGDAGAAPPSGLAAVRAVVSPAGPEWSLRAAASAETSPVLRFEAELPPGGRRVLEVRAPFTDLLEPAELGRLRSLRWETEVPGILAYWKERLARGMALDVPAPEVNDFYRANLWHIAITTDRDPGTGLFNHNVATFSYKVFANETVMVARSLDMRGEHAEAARYLEPFLRFQGREPLTGRFSTRDGVFHSAGAYTHGQYAMNHGFVLWGLADHYLVTRDRAWLERAAPGIVAACDFLIAERRSTLSPPAAPRSPVHGLAPACALEDVVEFQYWLATNGYFHLGMRKAGEALAAIGDPQAARVLREAELYRADIERAAREAATRAAAVRLRDGRWIPYVPSRVHQWRDLTEGWIREALYPALHLATTGVVGPRDPLMTWMLDELEDRTFFSAESGYAVADADERWFERGAVTLQPCLLDLPGTYLARDEVPAALRAFWNAYALLLHPEMRCLAEWAPRFGEAGGPLYKTSDEACWVMWLRQLLVWEDGDRLWLGRGVPREWLEDGKEVRVERAATRFGTVGLRLRSAVAAGRIRATVDLPARHPPAEAWLRLRHPGGKGPAAVLLDGRPLAGDRVRGEDIRLLPGGPGEGAARLEIEARY